MKFDNDIESKCLTNLRFVPHYTVISMNNQAINAELITHGM